jgi:two-component system, sensor histidine kinase and response regulator
MLSSLFQISTRFSKEGTAKEKGSGLGLIFCKEFIANNGGELWIESIPGQGTTVYFSLLRK